MALAQTLEEMYIECCSEFLMQHKEFAQQHYHYGMKMNLAVAKSCRDLEMIGFQFEPWSEVVIQDVLAWLPDSITERS